MQYNRSGHQGSLKLYHYDRHSLPGVESSDVLCLLWWLQVVGISGSVAVNVHRANMAHCPETIVKHRLMHQQQRMLSVVGVSAPIEDCKRAYW